MMKPVQYLVRRTDSQEIEYAVRLSNLDPTFVGPVSDEFHGWTVTPACEPGCELIEYAGDTLLSKAPTPTAVLRWDGTGPAWIEEGEMQALIDAAVTRCYTDIDAVYEVAIGKRQVEYTDAEADARAFVAGAVATENIAGFARANPTGTEQTNLWAAEQIIARADAFRAAQVAMRTQRFDSQAAMRACLTPADLAHVIYLWDAFIAGLRTQLGLT